MPLVFSLFSAVILHSFVVASSVAYPMGPFGTRVCVNTFTQFGSLLLVTPSCGRCALLCVSTVLEDFVSILPFSTRRPRDAEIF